MEREKQTGIQIARAVAALSIVYSSAPGCRTPTTMARVGVMRALNRRVVASARAD
jgi:hypothetical protein